jgi:uncharacterized caspase-like protein
MPFIAHSSLRLVAFLFAMVLTCAEATAAKRVALVIGNAAYQHTGKLGNPINDARDVGGALKAVGFEVIDGFDLDKAGMDRRIRDFAVALSGAEVGLFFYAGHGLQVAGANYLVPVDAQLSTAAALDFEMVRLDLVHRTMEREASTNIIFLDACRDNPLSRNLARAMGTRSAQVGQGLAAMESGIGTLISFSTQPGNVALDGVGRNSPFAGALVRQLGASTEDLSSLLIAVRNDVMKETQRRQVPWEHSAMTGRFYFKAPATDAAQSWAAIKETRDIATLEAFRRQYGTANPFFDRLAEMRIASLRAVPSVSPPTSGAAKSVVPAVTANGYTITKGLSIVGSRIASEYIRVDTDNPDLGLTRCELKCVAWSGCAAFDIGVVHGTCTLYKAPVKTQDLGGYYAGLKTK